ncbi:hypothetical protein PV327_003789 [Microctonus hyperodae]|uniref:CHK kinase-like domain-containing protein n=1 Tax=Microctonus hyperodae TaxID=165561 RepID=A0AA39L1J7_MICHY|nr:hypothetical protein PV327_003789 [Microctonus hyperodae]
MANSIVEVNKDELNVWLKSNIIEKLAKNLDQPYENITWEVSSPENCFYLSSVIFLKVNIEGKKILNSDECQDKCIYLVMKRPGLLMATKTLLPIASLFHNEILFYKFISHNNTDFPRCYYYSEDKNNLNNMVIVMENIGIKGYELCYKSYDIPFEYVISAMKTIGKFHAMSYAMKKQKPEVFFKIIENIEESRYFPGDDFSKYINLIALRPVEWLRKQNYDKVFVDSLENYMSNAFTNVMIDAITPIEPLATLCHGDFTRNNIFYHKTENKLESMLIDFAMLRYSSPSTDISTFLYLNCSNNDRSERFNEIFEAYHKSLIENLREEGIDDLKEYSYEKILKDYKRRAMYGFVIALFFLPILRGYTTFSLEDTVNFDYAKEARSTKKAGGDDLSREFSEILLELRDNGCLHHVCGNF